MLWGIFFVLMAGGLVAIMVWVVMSTRPKGEALGKFDVTAAKPETSFDAKTADEILFRLDYSFDVNPLKSALEGDEERFVRDVLSKSRLDVTLTDASGAKQQTSCKAYDGSAMTTGQTGFRHSMTGVNVPCKFLISRDGRYTVTGDVIFENVRRATAEIEVRRLRKSDTK